MVTRTDAVRVRAVRGATTVACDDPALIGDAVRELLQVIVVENGIETEDIVSAMFTTTPDLTSVFPASAARTIGWVDVPMMCASEIDVAGAQPRCIRVMLHVERLVGAAPVQHVYLREAVALRPDLCRAERQSAELTGAGRDGAGRSGVLAGVGGAL